MSKEFAGEVEINRVEINARLKQLGFTERGIERMAEHMPSISIDEVDQAIVELKVLGFKDPVKMINLWPNVLQLSSEDVSDKIQHLRDLGFKDPIRMLQLVPGLLNQKSETVERKIEELKKKGFKDPVRMISLVPGVLGYSTENIDQKINGLTERGFKDPVKLISSMPAMLGYGFGNIDKHLRFLERMNKLYRFEYDWPAIIEKSPMILSTKMEKIYILTRVLREYEVAIDGLEEAIIKRIITINLESALLALKDRVAGETIKDFVNRSKRIQKSNIPKEKMRSIISSELAEYEKIKRTYERGYIKDKIQGEHE